MWIEGFDIHDQPTRIEVPESIGLAIQEAIKNADRASTDPRGAGVFIKQSHENGRSDAIIAIAPDTTPVATIEIHQFDPRVSPRFTVAIDTDQEQIVGPLAKRFPDLNGHLVNLVLKNQK